MKKKHNTQSSVVCQWCAVYHFWKLQSSAVHMNKQNQVSIKTDGHEQGKFVSDSVWHCVFLRRVNIFLSPLLQYPCYLTQSQFSHNPSVSFTVDHLSSDSSPCLPSCWSTCSPPLLPSVTVAKPTFDSSISGTVSPVCVTSFSSPERCGLVTFCLPDVFWVQRSSGCVRRTIYSSDHSSWSDAAWKNCLQSSSASGQTYRLSYDWHML